MDMDVKDTRIVESLRGVQIFHDLNGQELLQIARLCQGRNVAADEVIFQEGQEGHELFIIYKGRVQVSLTTRHADGSTNQATINVLYTGQSFGELVLLDGNIRSATVTSIEPGMLLVLHAHDFANLCEASPRIGYRVMRYLAGDLAYKLRSSNLLLRGQIRWQHNELGQLRQDVN